MLQTRENVFETNSSSTHSISLGDGKYLMDTSMVPNAEGFVEIEGMEFGWEYATYTGAWAKAAYAVIYCLDWSYEKTDEHLQTLFNVIKEQTGCVGVKWQTESKSGWDYKPYYGYIDHQSVEGNALDYLFEDKETLRRFIFDKKSVLTTDNDNH